jgi:hypothetical protein
MSAPQYRIPPKLRALLRDRDCSVAKLAVQARLPLHRALRVLSRHPRSNSTDEMLVAACLTAEEVRILFPVEQTLSPANEA